MKPGNYFKDKIIIIILNITGMLFLAEYLGMAGNAASTIILIIILWVIVLVVYFIVSWYRCNKYFTELKERTGALEQLWLAAEVLPVSLNSCDREYQEIIRRIGAAAASQINKIEDGQKEYREYIENWVHEIKTPITFLYLLIGNNTIEEPVRKEIILELKRIENDVESALYYARLGTAYNDYLTRQVFLRKLLIEAVKNNRVLLTNRKINVKLICDENISVYSDGKWILFIINQIIINSVKYSKEENAGLVLEVTERQDKVMLSIKDNGTGICAEDLPRIFEKGYTGKNGHNNKKSTGIGLYLVKKMCERLDIEITAKSDGRDYTVMVLCFKKKLYFQSLTKL